jgi:hypothetical protein
MARENDKLQIGIRLYAALVRQIDQRRQQKTRAEYCRELIELALTADGHQAELGTETLARAIEALQEPLSRIQESSLVAERNGAESLAEMKDLRQDLATLAVGLLTKIGQAVRQEDQRIFAREKAERFVKETLFSLRSESDVVP